MDFQKPQITPTISHAQTIHLAFMRTVTITPRETSTSFFANQTRDVPAGTRPVPAFIDGAEAPVL